MTEANSPMYAQGRADGALDATLIAMCPPGVPMGPNPPNPDYPVMYLRGYHHAFDGAVAHECTERCRKNDR